MAKNLLWFVFGGATAVVVMLIYLGRSGGDAVSPPLARDSSRGDAAVSAARTSNAPPTNASSGADEVTQQPAPSRSEEAANQRSDSPLQEFAASLQTTPEEAGKLLQRSFDALSAHADRLQRFEDEARQQEQRLGPLENIVTNELWRNVNGNVPVTAETRCHQTGCRVKLYFGTNRELVAAAKSMFDKRLLFALRQFGFEAAESRVDFGDAEGPSNPQAPPRALDIYLWPKGFDALQSQSLLL